MIIRINRERRDPLYRLSHYKGVQTTISDEQYSRWWAVQEAYEDLQNELDVAYDDAVEDIG